MRQSEQLCLVEVLPSMSVNKMRKEVSKILKRYRKLPALILSAQNTIRFASKRRIESREEELAKVGMAYLPDMMKILQARIDKQQAEYGTVLVSNSIHRDRAENLFYSISGVNDEDEEVLDEIRGIMTGINPWEGWINGVTLDQSRTRVMTIRKSEENSAIKVAELESEQAAIETALNGLKSYAPELEKLLQLRFVEDKSVREVARELHISDRTYDQRRDEAIAEFAMLMGIT